MALASAGAISLMIEALIVLTIATVVVLGWFYGSVFFCVFLSIPTALFVVAVGASGGPASPQWATGGVIFLIFIWLPRILRRLVY